MTVPTAANITPITPITPVRVAGSAPTQRDRDLELVRQVASGDPLAFDRLHSLYRDRLYRFAVKRLRDSAEAEDVCQDVFMQVYKSIGSFEGRSSLLTWMFGIAHHQVCRRFRKRNLDAQSLDAPEARELPAEQVSADRQLDATRVFASYSQAVETKLGEVHREVFQLRYAENCSTKEIAERMGKSNQAIKISLFRSRQTLADATEGLDMLLSA